MTATNLLLQEHLTTTSAGGSRREPEGHTLIDRMLREQDSLTAVEKFAKTQNRNDLRQGLYRDLIPLSAPARGSQLAFEVDLDRCSGCKACVTACHALNGLERHESWREVELLVSEDWRRPYVQTVTAACHHCVDPGCLNGCPVLAYEKDPTTGIVRHLDDQCIGCQYCVMMCPYDVPRYSSSRGIVRKCDMCHQRLAVGEAPACVQACPNEAIRIVIAEKKLIQEQFRGSEISGGNISSLAGGRNRFLPASPDPAITLPATRYRSRAGLPQDLVPSGAGHLHPQAPHWPLIGLLVFTQLSAGAFLLLPILPTHLRPPLGMLGAIAVLLGLAASVAHLGQPLKAWRSFLGLRKSWLSREIVAFGLFLPLALISTVGLCWPWPFFSRFGSLIFFATVLAGLIGVLSSGMVYHRTKRPFWHASNVYPRFLGTALLLGLAAAWLASVFRASEILWLSVGLAAATATKLVAEHRSIRLFTHDAEETRPRESEANSWSLARSALLMRQELGLAARLRAFFGISGGVVFPLTSFVLPEVSLWFAALGFLLALSGEVSERYLFFRAVVPLKIA